MTRAITCQQASFPSGSCPGALSIPKLGRCGIHGPHAPKEQPLLQGIASWIVPKVLQVRLVVRSANRIASISARNMTDIAIVRWRTLPLGAIDSAQQMPCGPCITSPDVWGSTSALGTTREGKLALWQVMARVIDQGSRLSAVRLAMSARRL